MSSHTWQPSTLARDLTPIVLFNVRLGDGTLARVWCHAGWWNVRCENGAEHKRMTIEGICAWLAAEEARPL